jgi:ring-1,2-phenylacetyl-CoA epoxidase subunit PaaA
LEEFFNCTYKPLAQILPGIVKEEIGHIGYGESKTAELASKGDDSREKVQRALNFWYAKALDMFGRSESERDQRYIHWGLKRRTNAQARQEYVEEVNPLIKKIHLEVPDATVNRHYM